MARGFNREENQKLTVQEILELRKKLSAMARQELIIHYKACLNVCSNPDMRIPSAASVQEFGTDVEGTAEAGEYQSIPLTLISPRMKEQNISGGPAMEVTEPPIIACRCHRGAQLWMCIDTAFCSK
jgi:hypothetical protein